MARESYYKESRIDLSDISAVLNHETRILLFDRSGSGKVYFLLVQDEKGLSEDTIDLYTETWDELVYLKEFGVCANEDYVYIIGGCDIRTGKPTPVVKR